jgi:NADP-dependent 3-hydroxy acid dehydrogenase YdfG
MGAFAGKVAWVTGTGIGKAGALMFAREGAAVALIGWRRDKLEEVAAEVRPSAEPLPSSRWTSPTARRSERPPSA